MAVPKDHKWGHSLHEVPDNLLQVIQHYRDTNYNTVYLVAHDYGALAAIRMTKEYPSTLTKLILVDVAPFHLKDMSFRQTLVGVLYLDV